MPLAPALVSYLQSVGGQNPLLERDVFTITLQGGGIYHYAESDFQIAPAAPSVWNPPAYFGKGAGMWQQGMVWQPGIISSIDGQSAVWKVGLDSNRWVLVVNPRYIDPVVGTAFPDMLGSVGWIEAARGGALANADIVVSTAYFSSIPNPPPPGGVNPIGTKILFRGQVGEVDTGDSAVYLTVVDYRKIFTQMMPRNVYQAGCRHRLFDERCTLSAAGFTRAGAVGNGSTRISIVANAPIPAPGGSNTYSLGVLTMTSGLNAGFRRLVTNWDGNATLQLLHPFPFTIAAGDTFTVAAGCDKTKATCTAFANVANFGGEPTIPIPDVMLA